MLNTLKSGVLLLFSAALVKTRIEGSPISRYLPDIGYMVPSGPRMSIRIFPPGCTSISQIGFVNPFGPHHCARRWEVVHTFHTRDRDAGRMRVRVSSFSIVFVMNFSFLSTINRLFKYFKPGYRFSFYPYANTFRQALIVVGIFSAVKLS